MIQLEDLSGKRFGKLLVISRAPDYIQPSGQRKKMWHCKCDCGNFCDVRGSDLKSGNTSSCGCFQKSSRGKAQFQDLTGQRFGKLVVLFRLPNHITPSGQQQRRWRCRCDCGNEIDVYATQLKNGLLSCGCIKVERKKILDEMKAKKKALEKKRRLELIEKEKEKRKVIKEQEKENIRKQNAIKREEAKKELLLTNSLAAKRPELVAEWDFEKNGNVTPQDVFVGSGKKVWWLCPNKHSYEAAVSKKTGPKPQGCPYCSVPAKRVLQGFNDLATKYPQIASEWHPTKNGSLSPNNVLCGSEKKIWWLGKCGHEYEQSIVSRVRGGNCPYCSHQKLLIGFNDFATEHPELLGEWDYQKNTVSPNSIMSHSHYKAWWLCPFGHSYQSWMDNRTGPSHTGCNVCNKENHTSFPEQAMFYYIKKYFKDAINGDKTAIGMELDIYIPSIRIAVEYDGKTWHKDNDFEKKKNYMCNENNVFLIRIREDGLTLYDDCYCIVRKDVRSDDSLTNVIKELIQTIDSSINPDIDVNRDSAKIYESYIKERKAHSLLEMYPLVAREWHPTKNGSVTADMVAPMTNKKVWWLGKCGHEWQMSVQDRTNQNCGCPICSGKRIVSGVNDLLSKYPELCKEWDYELNEKIGLFPNKVSPHSDKKAWWKCRKCGNTWKSKIDGRTRMKSGCPKCGRALISKSKFKPVICIESGVIYQSLQEAEKETGISRSSIGNCCRGRQNTAGKLHWKFM